MAAVYHWASLEQRAAEGQVIDPALQEAVRVALEADREEEEERRL